MARLDRPPVRRRRQQPRFTLGMSEPPTRRLPPMPKLPLQRIGRYAAVIGGTFLVLFGAWWLWSGDTLRVQTVIVVGTEVVDPNAVAAAADIQGHPIVTLDTAAAIARIEALPGVRTAAVDRDLPRSVVIQVLEDRAWGWWQAAGIRSTIDAEGHVLKVARPPADNAPTIFEAGGAPLQAGDSADRDTVTLVTRLLSDGTFQRLNVTPTQFEFDRARGLTVRVAAGPAAVFGDSHDYEFKVDAWAALLERIQSEQIHAGEVDLRFGRELVVR